MRTHEQQQSTDRGLDELPTPVTATDRLRSIYRSPGPYASVYLTNADTVNGRLDRRFDVAIEQLREGGATDEALRAVEARMALPAPDDTAGVAIIAAADGTTIVDHALEPPHHDLAVVDELPHAAPLLEWQQHRIPHLVVTAFDGVTHLATFGADHYSRMDEVGPDVDAIVDRVGAAAEAVKAQLVVVFGEPGVTGELADALAFRLGPSVRLVVEEAPDHVDEMVDTTVRQVSDVNARRTVQLLREHRFLDDHGGAVSGRPETIDELADGTAARLLIHDSPLDQERIWIGDEPTDLSLTKRTGFRQARLVDALIRSAVLQGIPVRIIPSTGPTGPDDDTGAVVDQGPEFIE